MNTFLKYFFTVVAFLQMPAVLSAQQPYITQMHIHGWSNHNGAVKPGSLQFHNKQADSVNVDVLWWTEHHNIFKNQVLPLSFNGAIIDPVTLNIEGIAAGNSGDYSSWKCIRKDGISHATFVGNTLNLQLTSVNNNSTWESLAYAPRSLLGLIKDLEYVKPLASLPFLNFNLEPSGTSIDTKIKLVVKLSWHYRQTKGQDVVVFELLNGISDTVTYTNNNDSVFVRIPLTGNPQLISLDIHKAASNLNHGIDNTISDIQLHLMCRQGATYSAKFKDFELVPHQTIPDSIAAAEREILDYYTSIGKTHNLLGVEYSKTPHLNGYIPKYAFNQDLFLGVNSGDAENWVDLVHQNGGLVSYNHMFGTNWITDTDATQNYRADTMAQFIFDNNAFGADILEVGYIKRGGGDLRRHLRVWDKLTAKGLFLYGNGVSDSHGDEWMQNSSIFHTWIYAPDSSDASLLAALSQGRICFGIYNRFQGDFWYKAGNLQLGDRGFSDVQFQQLEIYLTGTPPGSIIKLTQALIDDSQDIQYIYDEVPVNLFEPPVLNFGKPCFIRLGVYDAAGNPLIFGQPIVVMGVLNDSALFEFPDENKIITFPNPVNEQVYISFTVVKYGNYKINLLDERSRKIATIEDRFFYNGKYGYSHDCSHLAAGIYFVEVVGEGNTITKKIVVQ